MTSGDLGTGGNGVSCSSMCTGHFDRSALIDAKALDGDPVKGF